MSPRAISENDYLEAQWRFEESQAKRSQAQAEKEARGARGIGNARVDITRSRLALADAWAKLQILNTGSRPEEIDAARAVLEQRQHELQELLVRRDQLDVFAPASGVLVTADLDKLVGTFLKKGDLICTVANTSDPTFRITVDEKYSSRLRPGQSVQLKARAFPYQILQGTLSRIAPMTSMENFSVGERGSESIKRSPLAADHDLPSMLVPNVRSETNRSPLCPGMTGYARIQLEERSLGAILTDRSLRFVRREFWW